MSTSPDWVSRCRIPPYAHQVVGVERIVESPFFLLGDEMGAGKTKQSIDAAQVLAVRGKINKVLIITEASIRPVWFDQELGELGKHLWLPSRVAEYHKDLRLWFYGDGEPVLTWGVTNYDYIINEDRLAELRGWVDKQTFLILDESSAVKNHKTARAKACNLLRWKCGHVLLLNGTPVANSPKDMYSQGQIMSPSILQVSGITQFMARYAQMGGYTAEVKRGGRTFLIPTQVQKWINIDDLQQRFAPYTLRRLKDDCLDLPPKLPSVMLTAEMNKDRWKQYRAMRDQMVVWLDSGVTSATQIITKLMRLSQMTSGFLGGVESFNDLIQDHSEGEQPSWLPTLPLDFDPTEAPEPVQEIGREKLDVFLEFFERGLGEDPNFKVYVACNFRPELLRLVKEMRRVYPKVQTLGLYGGQSKPERELALRLLHPEAATRGPAVLAATIGTGAKGHNFTAAHTVVNMSFNPSLEKYLQMMDRVHRPGQKHAVSYYDIVATGPTGQKTIDHTNIKAREAKQELATWTMAAWVRKALSEE